MPPIWCDVCNVDHSFKEVTTAGLSTSSEKNEAVMMNKSKLLHCDLCNVPLNSQASAKQHYAGKKHLNKVEKKTGKLCGLVFE